MIRSGTELTEKFRARYPDIPVLMVTANHETELRHQALQIGVTDFLNKPLDNTEFLARAKNMLALRTISAKWVRRILFCSNRASSRRLNLPS